MLRQAFYTIRSERQLMEPLKFDLLFRWFVGLGIDDPAWYHSTFSKKVGPHVAQNSNRRRSAIDKRTTRHPGYTVTISIRKRIEEAFNWIKTVAGMRKTKLCGLEKVDWAFTFTAAAYNLVWLPKLLAVSP